ncbi:probable ATP-dependent RNA helicase DDX28 [Cylas formicarius]|uniref:probable ATP-dependent RNA helicase DDX28 n=1 Tax=Cylas formicarius TaxID=197179 RepID=UPI0029587A86|nr:probable ATP-dependent RNA helicase DDX28 [Cylas formicarius]
MNDVGMNSPKIVILVPNRELAYQIGEAATILSSPVGLNVRIVVGGRTKKMMVNPVFEDVDILVSTPGVLGKLSTVGVYRLSDVRWVVFDEADTLLDDSFIERVETLIKKMSQAQLILVSATLPRKVPDCLAPYEATMEQVLSPRLHKPLLNITQKFLRTLKSTRPSHLLQIAKNNKDPMLIFTNRSPTNHWVALFLRENGIPCANINGDQNYAVRIEQWNQFVSGKVNILAATDVGSRGLNTVQVKSVLNYDFPEFVADYIHRIGRVGRIGSARLCKATNLIWSKEDVKMVQDIELAIRRNEPISNVDGNTTGLFQRRLLQRVRDSY